MFHHFVDTLVAWGPLGILLLAILDSVVPVAGVFDVLIAVFAAQRPAIGWWCAACAVVGSTAGNYVLFHAARRGGRRYLNESAGSSPRAKKFRAWFERYGLITVFIPALLPIPMPLKLFVVSAGALGTKIRSFLLVVVLARTFRYFGMAWLGVNLGKGAGAFLLAHAWHFVAAAVLLFLVLYGAVRLSDRQRTRSQVKLDL